MKTKEKENGEDTVDIQNIIQCGPSVSVLKDTHLYGFQFVKPFVHVLNSSPKIAAAVINSNNLDWIHTPKTQS